MGRNHVGILILQLNGFMFGMYTIPLKVDYFNDISK